MFHRGPWFPRRATLERESLALKRCHFCSSSSSRQDQIHQRSLLRSVHSFSCLCPRTLRACARAHLPPLTLLSYPTSSKRPHERPPMTSSRLNKHRLTDSTGASGEGVPQGRGKGGGGGGGGGLQKQARPRELGTLSYILCACSPRRHKNKISPKSNKPRS